VQDDVIEAKRDERDVPLIIGGGTAASTGISLGGRYRP
jgi:hypothetical protein